jgi:hypothetical protein
MDRPHVFLSYSHRDDPVLESLLPFLATLDRERLVAVWSDRQIQGGERWQTEIDAALDAASIAVLLISQEFLASSFVRDEELPRILKRQLEGRLTVLPVFVSPSTVTSDSVVIRDAEGGERRIVLSEFEGFGKPDKTLSELELSALQRVFVALHDRIRALSTGRPDAIDQPPTNRDEPDKQTADAQHHRISRIPFPRNRTFTGREAYLQRLHEELGSGKPAAVTQALAGLGGIGKTQLALEYSYRYGNEYGVLWWIRAENVDTRLDDLRALGHALAVDKGVDPSLVVEATLEALDRRDDWLLVFDNAEHPDDIGALFPKSGRGRIVITSRYPAWGAVARTMSLGLWTKEEAAEYLSQRTGMGCSEAAAAVAETLGYLPLALSQAAAYIDETGSGFEGYLALLKERPAETLKLRSNSSDAERAVAAVWDIAFERVAASSPAAVDLLNLFAFLPPDRIPRRLLVEQVDRLQPDRLPPLVRTTVEDPFALDAAVGALRRYSLVDTSSDAFSVHRLVQAVVRARLDNDTYRLLSETAKDLEIGPSALTGMEPLVPSAPASKKPMPMVRYAAWAMVLVAIVTRAAMVVPDMWTSLRRMVARDLFSPQKTDRPASGENGVAAVDTALGAAATRPLPANPAIIPAISIDVGLTFDGIRADKTAPPDPSGAAGPHHYIHTAATEFAIYDKGGKELRAPSPIRTLWKGYGGPCETADVLELTALYDHLADRWLLIHTAKGSSTEQQCFAVSKTSDPLHGGWHLYAFRIDPSIGGFSDYPKLAVWPDGYYMGASIFVHNESLGSDVWVSDVWVFERQAMLQGKIAKHIRRQAADEEFLMPADFDGPAPPEGTPAFFLRYKRDYLELFAFHVDWSDVRMSTLEAVARIDTEPFRIADCDCVPQPETDTQLQLIGDRMMWPVQYRNFGTYETLVANHTVNVGSRHKVVAGIRWYELRKPATGSWSMFQQGTFAPDDRTNRWMGSIAMDGGGNIALGYSVSSKIVPPGIRYVSRLRDDPPGKMGYEKALFDGRGSQTQLSRWGGNSSMTVDPTAPCTFWYTNEYLPANGSLNWRTRITSFRLPGCKGAK